MKTKWFSLLKFNVFEFGEQKVSQFVIFECKYLFSIIIFYFHKCNKTQDRYHTHAFNAISIKLWGKYIEYIYKEGSGGKEWSIKKRVAIFKYFKRDHFHKIGNSTGCCTILLSGPWSKTWKEVLDNGEVKEYTWGRE